MSGLQSTLMGGGKTFKFQEFLASGTFTPSAALLAAGGIVGYDLRGAGGGGGGNGGAQGGGGGGSSKLTGFTVVAGPVSVVIAASAPGATDGSASSFGSITVAGGKKGNSASIGPGGPGGQGFPGGSGSNTGGFNGPGGGEGGGSPGGGVGGAGVPNTGGGGGGANTTGGASGSGYCLVTWWE